MSTENLWGGYVSDTDPSLGVQSSNLKFGLNTRVLLTGFEYSTATGKAGSEGNPALVIKIDVNGTERNIRKYDPTIPGGKVYHRGVEVIGSNSPDYAAGLQEAVKQVKAFVTHFLKATGKTEEQIQAIYATATNFQSLITAAQTAIQPSIAGKVPMDLFLQYQSKITSGQDRSYLEIPTSLLYGAFITAHIPPVGEWKEETSWSEKQADGSELMKNGIRYVDNSGNVHRFDRDETFMKSKNATMQTTTANTTGIAGNPQPVQPVAQGAGNPQQQAWT